MNGIAAQLQNEFPKSNANRGVSVEPLHLNFVTDSTRRNLWLLLGAVGFLLLIGCVNVANLFWRVARRVRKKSQSERRWARREAACLLSFLLKVWCSLCSGGALGIFLAGAIIDAITAVMPPVGTMLPSEANIRISIPVLLFTIGVTTLAGLLFGAAPAWQATRLDLNEVLKLGGRTGSGGVRRKALRVLVVAEFSLALTLLATGGFALRGFWNLTRIDLGIQTDNVLTFRLACSGKSSEWTRSDPLVLRADARTNPDPPGCDEGRGDDGCARSWLIVGHSCRDRGPTRRILQNVAARVFR